MASPMILIHRDLIGTLHAEHTLGVPYLKLIRKHKLPITAPTLTKLLGYYGEMVGMQGYLRVRIEGSLFPDWLKEGVQVQPNEWYYTGVMPSGEWVQR